MPALPDAPDTIKLKFSWVASSSKTFGSRLFVRYSGGPPSASDLTQYCIDASLAYSSHVNAYVSNQVTLTEVEATDIASSSGNVGANAPAETGAQLHNTVSDDTAAVLRFSIPRRYRGGQPKSFWPIGTSSDLANGSVWNNTPLSSWITAVENFVGGIIGNTYGSFSTVTLVNVSYYSGFTAVENILTGRYRNVPKLRTSPTIDIAAFTDIDPRLGSQRRRRA